MNEHISYQSKSIACNLLFFLLELHFYLSLHLRLLPPYSVCKIQIRCFGLFFLFLNHMNSKFLTSKPHFYSLLKNLKLHIHVKHTHLLFMFFLQRLFFQILYLMLQIRNRMNLIQLFLLVLILYMLMLFNLVHLLIILVSFTLIMKGKSLVHLFFIFDYLFDSFLTIIID